MMAVSPLPGLHKLLLSKWGSNKVRRYFQKRVSRIGEALFFILCLLVDQEEGS
jgi:hypothetical protein